MPLLQVQKVELKKELEFGNVYTVMGLLDGELDSVEFTTKPANAPKVGEKIDVDIEESQWGKKAKRKRAGAPFMGGGRSPEEQEMIMRQHAVTDVIAKFAVGAQFMKKEVVAAMTDEMLFTKALKYVEFYKTGKSASSPREGIVGLVHGEIEGSDGEMDLSVFDGE